MQTDHHTLFVATAVIATFIAAITDLRSGTIPNRLTLPILVAAPLVHGLLLGPGALGHSLLGAILCAAVPALLFAVNGMGGGDLKLFAALGALMGVETGLQIELMSLCLMLIYAFAQLAWRGTLWRTLARAFRLLLQPLRRRSEAAQTVTPELMTTMRLGGAICCATWLVLVGAEYMPWLSV